MILLMATATTLILHSSPTPPCFSLGKLVNHSQMAMHHDHKNKKKRKSFSIEIRSSSICNRTRKNKIFEDLPKGIICFRDELTGEITCEGYDEGPRSPPPPPTILNYHHPHPRDAEIIDLLLIHQSWHQLVINGTGDQTGFPNHHHGFTYWDNYNNN